MSEIIDLITARDIGRFTCNNAVNLVNITPNAGGDINFINSVGMSRLVAGDSFSILSISIIIPHGYSFAEIPSNTTFILPTIRITATTDNLAFRSILAVSHNGTIALPWANYEMSLGVYQSHAQLVDLTALPPATDYILSGIFVAPTVYKVSMIGSPTLMNAVVLPVHLQMKILHTLPMVS
jgi:hypothetical protein